MQQRWVIWLLVACLGSMTGGAWGQEEGGMADRKEAESRLDSIVNRIVEAASEGEDAIIGAIQNMNAPDGLMGVVMARAARELLAQGRYEASIMLNERVLTDFEDFLGSESREVLAVKNNIAEALRNQGNLPGALSLHREVLAVREEVLGYNHSDTLASRNNLALTLYSQGDLPTARSLQESLLETLEQTLGARHSRTLTAKNNLALTLFAQGKFPEARILQEETLSDRMQVLGPDHYSTLATKNNLAQTLFAIGKLSDAQDLQKDISVALELLLGPEHPRTLLAKHNLAVILKAQGYNSDARALQTEVLAARERILGADHPDTLSSKNNLAQTFLALGDLSGAQTLQNEVLVARERILGSGHPDTLTSKNNLAQSLLLLGDLAGARVLQEEVLAEIEQVVGKGHPRVLVAKGNLAQILKAQGNAADARVLQQDILAAHEETLGLDHPETLTARGNLAHTLKILGNLEDARDLQEAVLTARERLLGLDHPDTLITKNNLAETLKAQGDLSAARDLHESVLKARERISGLDHLSTSISRHNLASTLYLLGELAGARQTWEAVLATIDRILGTDRSRDTDLEVQVLSYLAGVYSDLGEDQLAVDTSLEALGALERQARLSGDVEELRSKFKQQYDSQYIETIGLLLGQGRIENAFEILQRYRAQSLLRRLEQHKIESGDIPGELMNRRRVLTRQYDRTIRAVYAADSEKQRQPLKDELKRLRRKQQKVTASIWARIPGGDPTIELADITFAQEALDSGTLLISYIARPEETIIFTLTAKGPLEVHQEEGGRVELARQLDRLHGQLEDDPRIHQDANSVNRQLADQLIVPIADRIDAAERLVIVPDGPLHFLPFSALIRKSSDGTSEFLIEAKPIHLAASASVYARAQRGKQMRDRPVESHGDEKRLAIVAFGDPSYPESLLSSDTANPPESGISAQGTAARTILDAVEHRLFTGLKPLPNSRREVVAIKQFYGEGDETAIHLGTSASEANFKRDAPHARVIHIAAHGLAKSDRPFDSFVALTLSEELDEDEPENGLLQAWELFDGNVPLDADLVVLSACETALGENRGGEGIISLARAFQVAGARSVVASMWTVADDSTAELMMRFHRYLRQGMTKDVALQQAQIDLIRGRPGPEGEVVEERFSAPYHWAAFQLFGDWR